MAINTAPALPSNLPSFTDLLVIWLPLASIARTSNT